MKRKFVLTAACTTVLLATFSIGVTFAYLVNSADPVQVSISAATVEADVELKLAAYGVPGDTLDDAYGDVGDGAPAKSTVTVTNTGTADMVYKLSLAVDSDTAELLETDGFALKNSNGSVPLSPSGSAYVYYGVLDAGANPEVFDLALTFKGEALTDGNEYQGVPIQITPSIEACQATPSAVLDIFGKTYEGGVIQ